LTVAVIASLVATSLVTKAEAVDVTPAAGQSLPSFIRQLTFPEKSTGCVVGSATRPLPDHARKLTATIPCTSPAVIPAPLTVRPGFESESGNAFAGKLAELANINFAEAYATLVAATGWSQFRIATSTVTEIGSRILLRHASVTGLNGGTVIERTNVCGKYGSSIRCGQLSTPQQERLFWGAVGAAVGGATGGALGAIIGAIIGWIIGAL
jgi:hypothetical protein